MTADQPDAAQAAAPPGPSGRIRALDGLRGAAVVAMAVYHTAWDLSALRLVETTVAGHPAWNVVARVVAASFLVLSGLSLALAHGRALRLRSFLLRLAKVAAAALLVSVATRIVFPQAWVFFGILHNIALSSLVALLAIRLGPWAGAIGAALFVGAPFVLSGGLFDQPALLVLGLGGAPPATNDWVPLFPWTGAMLAGTALSPLLLALRAVPQAPPVLRRPVRALAWLGAHSLPVYLLHQPLIYGALLAYLTVVGPNAAAVSAPFREGCARSCEAAGQSGSRCRRACSCTVDGLQREGLWPAVLNNSLPPDDAPRVGAVARACLKGLSD